MDSILLTEEERNALWDKWEKEDPFQRIHWEQIITNAQLKNVIEWGDSICMEHGMRKRRRCDKCWQALRKEVGIK